jgi:hypothetical protein
VEEGAIPYGGTKLMEHATFVIDGDIYRVILMDPDPVMLMQEFKVRKNGKLFRKGLLSAAESEAVNLATPDLLRTIAETAAHAPEDECNPDVAF